MPRITFGDSFKQTLYGEFGLDVTKEGYISKNGSRLTDGYGSPIHIDNDGGFVEFESLAYTVSEEGFVVNSEGKRISPHEEGREKEALIIFEYEGAKHALIRSGSGYMDEYVNGEADN